MSNRVSLFFRALKEMNRFNSLEPEERSIVFYSEDNASVVHFEPILKELLRTHKTRICYLTSSPDDPILKSQDNLVKPFYIGMGLVRTILFYNLQARIMVMTMPDLENYYIKRSRKHPVHYICVFHNMVSTHMVFRFGAYDHYDTIFCVGPHHLTEVRTAEALYHLKSKTLINHGNSRLDTLLLEASDHPDPQPTSDGIGKRVLIAPSYGDNALLEVCGCELVEVLLKAGHQVTVRPHPLTLSKRKDVISSLEQRFGDHPKYIMETNTASKESLYASHIMISDYSGAALEFAFSLEHPVVFIDVPRKVNNPEYEKLDCEPFEVHIRDKIGAVVSPDNLAEVPQRVDELCLDPESHKQKIRDIRSKNIFNVGSSGVVGAKYIVNKVEKLTQVSQKKDSSHSH